MARKKTKEEKETKMMTEKDKSLDLAMKKIQQYKKQIEKEQDLREKSGLYFWL